MNSKCDETWTIRHQEARAWSYFNQRWSKRPTKPRHDLEGPSVVFGRRSCPRDRGVLAAFG
ncbi:hypothetical protein U9M48_026177 [Paspalum notatum var. saurae]|uniref:Uncharacterized protein n=1 Tax=Paspalum notatum var. saurae TaxID=547442 RepID=A0AAQ3WYR3_PASNO